MHSIEFSTTKNNIAQITIDENGEEITVKVGKKNGSISLAFRESENSEFFYHITNLSFESIKRQGIGTECLIFHKNRFNAPITASSTSDPTQLSDGSHLTGDGVAFIEAMREKGLVCNDSNENYG